MKTETRARTLAATLMVAVLALSIIPHVVPTASAATTTRVLAITAAVANPQVPWQTFDGNPPKVFDINGDGQLEIIAQNDNNWVYIFDSKTGHILFEATTRFPTGWGARTFNGPEVAIMKEGTKPRLVVENSAAYITVFEFDPTTSTNSHFAFKKLWDRRLSDCHDNPGSDSKPVLADLDRDGTMEIIASTEESGIYALKQDGSLYWKKCIGGGNAEPNVGDLNMDGWPDVVFGSDAGVITAWKAQCTTAPPCPTPNLWTPIDARVKYNLRSGSMPEGVAIGQLDGKLGPDIVVGARDSHNTTDFSKDHALLIAVSSTGAVLWAKQDPIGNPLTYTHAVITDAADDGTPEVYWADWNTIGHKGGIDPKYDWSVTGPAHFYRYAANGTMVWRQTLDTWWSNKDITLADVDGDGVQEILANGPSAGGHDGIWYLDSRTGAKETFVDLYPWKLARGPIIADLWNTGTMQWVAEVGPHTSDAGGPALLVYDTGVPYNSKYPHLPYPTIGPTVTPPPPPPPGSSFNATFTIKAPNEWWQELYITPEGSHTITKAQVRINTGAWQTMTKSSWGAWTSSYHSVAGSKVEFLVTDADNLVSQSLPFTWMDGTLTRGSTTSDPSPTPTPPTTTTTPPTTTPPTTTPPTTTPPTTTPPTTTTVPPPPPGEFDATFTVSPNVNEWWVEVNVTSPGQTISAVEVNVNGASSWSILAKQSWGNWAKSMNVPKGSSVLFRAYNTTGATDTSDVVYWMTGAPPPPPPPEFTATFDPRAVGNDWWIEVLVTSSHTISLVETNVNGSGWKPLQLQDWGTWAKSYNAPNGSSVVFRATDSAGAQVTSQTVVWT